MKVKPEMLYAGKFGIWNPLPCISATKSVCVIDFKIPLREHEYEALHLR